MFGVLATIAIILIAVGIIVLIKSVSKLTKNKPQPSIPIEPKDKPKDVATGTKSRVEQLKELQSLFESGLITREDLDAQKQRILKS